jgi:hypothetical protein
VLVAVARHNLHPIFKPAAQSRLGAASLFDRMVTLR